MKKLVLVFMVALAIVSCQKKETQPTTPATQDVTFSVTEVTPDLKSTDEWICVDNIPTNAWIRLNDGTGPVDYYPELFELDGQLYTQAIKLPVLADGEDYCIEIFILYEEVDGNLGYDETNTTDVIVFGTPMEDDIDDSGYDIYVQWPLEYCFTVDAFAKEQIPMEVLCFQPAEYQNFGFDWFAITEIVIRQACFFGDICIDDPTFYANDQYYSVGGVQVDEEAVIQVIVKADGTEVPYSPFTNEDIYGDGKVLCVDYPDNLSIDGETFTFEVQVWQPDGSGVFYWQTYDTYTTTDDNPLAETDNDQDANTDNDDGVVDFAVGTCSPDSYPIYDWLLPPPPVCDPFQGFEVDTDGWMDGIATRVPDGTNNITAATGDYFAMFTTPTGTIDDAPWTRYCDYSCEWTNGWYSTMDVYLDPSWGIGEGFDFTTAINRASDCSHLRDFIWHVGVVDGSGLLVTLVQSR